MATESIFYVAFWVLFGGLLLMRVYFSLRVRQAGERLMPDHEAIEREGRGMFSIRVAAFFLLIALLVLYALNAPWIVALAIPLPDWLRGAGFALGLASLALWAWTQATLGTEWSPQLQLRKGHHLVTSGPYARVRHPLYTAMLGIATAFALVTAHWVFVALGIRSIVGLFVRVPREERMMLDEFGPEYAAYRQRTGRFLPRLFRSGG